MTSPYLSKRLYEDNKSLFSHFKAPNEHGVYIIKMYDDEGTVFSKCKIGLTSDPIARLNTIQACNPFKIKYAWIEHMDSRRHAQTFEATMHQYLDKRRIHGEWFNIHPQDAIEAIDRGYGN